MSNQALPEATRGTIATLLGNETVLLSPGPDGSVLMADSTSDNGINWTTTIPTLAITTNLTASIVTGALAGPTRALPGTPSAANATDRILFVNSDSGAWALTLEAAFKVTDGLQITFVKLDNNSNLAITITPTGMDKISGNDTYVLMQQYHSVTLVAQNGNLWSPAGWYVIAEDKQIPSADFPGTATGTDKNVLNAVVAILEANGFCASS